MWNFAISLNRSKLLGFQERCSELRKAQSEVCWLNFSVRIESLGVLVSFEYEGPSSYFSCSELFLIKLTIPNKLVLKDICSICTPNIFIMLCYHLRMCSKYGLCIKNISTSSQVQTKAFMPNFVKNLYVPRTLNCSHVY